MVSQIVKIMSELSCDGGAADDPTTHDADCDERSGTREKLRAIDSQRGPMQRERAVKGATWAA